MPDYQLLLLEKQLVGLAQQMTVDLIMTARALLICVCTNQTVADARKLMSLGYDQLPLIDDAHEIVGLVRRAALVETSDTDHVSGYAVMSHGLKAVRTNDPIDAAIDVLSSTDSTLVFDPSTGRFCGLLHIADLNKQAVRVFLYLWLSALEMGLAEYLRKFHRRLKEWLDSVPSSNRPSFLGDFILRRRQRIDLSPVEGLYFSDMLVILRKLPSAPERLGLPKKDFDSMTKPEPLGELRNMAMHPVRAIVHSSPDAVKLRERLAIVKKLIVATTAAIDRSEGQAR